MNTSRPGEFSFSPSCPYQPLTNYSCPFSSYGWKYSESTPMPECGYVAYDPLMFPLWAGFQAGTYLLGLELTIQLLFHFSRTSLYFWSIFASSWGSIVFAIFQLVLQNTPDSKIYGAVFLNIGWVAMVTGFSFVLYSRLNLLNPQPFLMRIILAVILVDALLFHVPVFVTVIVSSIKYTPATWKAYHISSFTEVAFVVQEIALTTLYIYLFLRATRERRHETATRNVLIQLFVAEFVVLSTDVIVTVLLYAEFYMPRSIIHSFASVLKLKIEFAVLNSLRSYSKSQMARQGNLDWLGPDKAAVTPSTDGITQRSPPNMLGMTDTK